MERIIRLHPFVDGNKRTSLFAMVEFLQQNGFTILLPLDAVRKTVSIAEYKKLDSKSNERLINEIGEWIKKHSQSNNAHSLQKILPLIRWMLKPLILTALIKLGMIRSARKRLEFWLAYDIHPEYRDMESSIWVYYPSLFRKICRPCYHSFQGEGKTIYVQFTKINNLAKYC